MRVRAKANGMKPITLLVALMCAVLSVACSADPSPKPAATSTNVAIVSLTRPRATPTPIRATPEPTATLVPYAGPVASPTNCPIVPRVCQLAEGLDKAVRAGDLEPLISLIQLKEFTYPGLHGPGGPDPLCQDAEQGEKRNGIDFYHPFESAAMSAEQLRDAIEQTRGPQNPGDQFGPGDLRLVALGCLTDCKDTFSLTFSALGSVGGDRPVRRFRSFSFEWTNSGPPTFNHVSFYWVISPALLQIMVGSETPNGRTIPWRP